MTQSNQTGSAAIVPNVHKPPGSSAAKIFVLYTGGTFGMKPDIATPGHPLRPVDSAALKSVLHDSDHLNDHISVTLDQFDPLLDSSSMTPDNWMQIARKIEGNYNSHDGFIIIHGTDTLAYTASALSFLLEGLGKPVVVTGSQLPLFQAESDASVNYKHALQIAGYRASGLPLVAEVSVVFGGKLLRGCRTRKVSVSDIVGFDSPNFPVLGELGDDIRIFEDRLLQPTGQPLKVAGSLNPNVLDFCLYPGLRSDHLSQLLDTGEIGGLVLRSFGAGNAPEDARFRSALKQGASRTRVAVTISQCPVGMVELGRYGASAALIDAGFISGMDMTPEAALSKLMVLLAKYPDDQARREMQVSQRGEQSQNLFQFDFKVPGEPVQEAWTDTVAPDQRFDPAALSGAVLRMTNVAAETDKLPVNQAEASIADPHVDIFMNYPGAKAGMIGQEAHPHWIHRLSLDIGGTCDVVQELSAEKLQQILGSGETSLTLVPSAGSSVSFDKLSLSMFTRA